MQREAMFGGAGGGGKTEALIGGSLQHVETPGYSAIILRRKSTSFEKADSIMRRMLGQVMGQPGVHWNGQKRTLFFETVGAPSTIEFGYLDRNEHLMNYRGSSYQYIAFEELTEFTEYLYRNMAKSLRRVKGSTIPLKIRSGTNPRGVGHTWVKQRFVDPRSGDRPFIPALMEDNPYLDIEAYRESLEMMTPLERKAIEEGDWDTEDVGAWFPSSKVLIVEAAPANMTQNRRWDPAATEKTQENDPDFTASVKMGIGPDDGFTYITDYTECRLNPGPRDEFIKATVVFDGVPVRQVIEQEGGSGGKAQVDHLIRVVLQGYSAYGKRSTGSKQLRAAPLQAQWAAGNVRLVRGRWNKIYLERMEPFPTKGVHDDATDASSGAYEDCTTNAGIGITIGNVHNSNEGKSFDDW